MRVLVACEFSGVVRSAFRKLGHDAWSCDLIPALDGSQYHIQGDVLAVLSNGWDLMIAHPPCTYLCVSGARWWGERKQEQELAVEFAKALFCCAISKICMENPIGCLSTRIRKPNQIIQPWMFGHGETKATSLWLKNLPLLKPTNIVDGREARIHKMPPSADRWKLRSTTYQGIADAMAQQWGNG